MPCIGYEETGNDEQAGISSGTTPPGLVVGMGRVCCLYRTGSFAAVVNTRNSYIRVYDDTGVDVVPPFLVGEVAGSLSVDADREQLKVFAESILEWLAQSEQSGGARIYRLPRR